MSDDRPRLTQPPAFAEEDAPEFFPTGSTTLDCALSGGWARNRVLNVVGDRSTGKTLLAIEACINFYMHLRPRFDNVRARYGECESAFDRPYALEMGMPQEVEFPEADEPLRTVEDFHADLNRFIDKKGGKGPLLYILDSLDSLSDKAEMDRDFGEGSYGVGKAKLMSNLFRDMATPMAQAQCTLFIISQIRDKIGVMFGEKHTRSGGRALDFYASHIVWLSEVGKIKRQYRGIERVIGIETMAKVKKNKVGPAFREAPMELLFGYGIDDDNSIIGWLHKAKAFDRMGTTEKEVQGKLDNLRRNKDYPGLRELHEYLAGKLRDEWAAIEAEIAPNVSKYTEA